MALQHLYEPDKRELMRISSHELQHVDLIGLTNRLQALGWVRNVQSGLLKSPNGQFFFLPRDLQNELDFESLRSIVVALLEIENIQNLNDLTHRISGRKEDMLFFGCEVLGTRPGRLPFRLATKFYEMSTRYFRTVTTSLIDDTRQQVGQSSRNIFDRLEYGETGEGSYLVRVHVPLDTIPDPVSRKFIRKSVASFESLRSAMSTEDEDKMLQDTTAGWTASMCEAMLKFSEQKEFSEIKMKASPDPIWLEGPEIEKSELVIPVNQSHVSGVLTRASAKLRGLQESQYVEVIGIPYASRDNAIISEGDERSIDIKWLRESLPPMKVHALFKSEAYAEALKAISKQQIKVTGWLRQVSSRWVLEVDGAPSLLDVVDLSVIQNENHLGDRSEVDDLI